MSGANRISGQGRLTPAKTARFTFDGKTIDALVGDTVAQQHCGHIQEMPTARRPVVGGLACRIGGCRQRQRLAFGQYLLRSGQHGLLLLGPPQLPDTQAGESADHQ